MTRTVSIAEEGLRNILVDSIDDNLNKIVFALEDSTPTEFIERISFLSVLAVPVVCLYSAAYLTAAVFDGFYILVKKPKERIRASQIAGRCWDTGYNGIL